MFDPVAITGTLAGRVIIAAITLSSFGIYKILNDRSTGGSEMVTRWDRAIPFLPVFGIPYLFYLPYLVVLITYGILATPYYAGIAASTLAVQLIAAFIYARHDTYVPRPVTPQKDRPFHRLAAFIYEHDRPYCAYPSLHVAYSVLCGYWTAMIFPASLPIVAVLTLAIILSTVFLKQHVLADVVGGVALAVLCLMVVTR